MAVQQIERVRRSYNQWVANQTLEDYALRFTAKKARRWSSLRVANTALGAISFLALEAIGAAVTLNHGFTNATAAILVVGTLIFLLGLPISYYAVKFGIDIDLLTRGAGFGYIGSTVTSLIYASFTFIFFAIEAAIMAMALEMCLGIPLSLGYLISALVAIPLVTHGITFISRIQLWTQPFWIVLHLLPFLFILSSSLEPFRDWTGFTGIQETSDGSFSLLAFGAASAVIFSLVAQIGEQVDFLRFLPRRTPGSHRLWWFSLIAAGPGWIILGTIKLFAGSFLAYFALNSGIAAEHAGEPTHMYLVAFQQVVTSPEVALGLTGTFVVLSQIKINVTNAYAGSIAWSNFFSRVTHSHPGRVVWLVFNVVIALLLMELGIWRALEDILGLYSIVAVAWVGALVADLVVNKPLGLSPKGIEFKRAHLYDINPVGFGAMTVATAVAILAHLEFFGETARALSSFLALGVAFVLSPLIAYGTNGRYYIARAPRQDWKCETIACCICEHEFEAEDMTHCPAFAGPICSLCCSLDARCHDVCKPQARMSAQIYHVLSSLLPVRWVPTIYSRFGHYLGILVIVSAFTGLVLSLVYLQSTLDPGAPALEIASVLWKLFFILFLIAGVMVWIWVLTRESRLFAEEETRRQTALLLQEIAAHEETDKQLQRAKEVAEAANLAKSRYIVGISHELRTPLNAIYGYAQLLSRDTSLSVRRSNAVDVIRRSSEHLSGLIEGVLDISKIEAGRLHIFRDPVPIHVFLEQIVDMFELQARAKGIVFRFEKSRHLPQRVYTDEKRLRQILINLMSNAIKFTAKGSVVFHVHYRNQIVQFEVADTGCGIAREDAERIFEPFERAQMPGAPAAPGTGLGLTITRLMVEIMGGEITLDSEPGRGSRFTVRLMLASATDTAPIAKPEQMITGYAGEPRTILVVDDDAAHRNLIHEILAPLGFIVLDAEDGPGCLEMVRIHEPDLLLIDITMPGMSGWDVAATIRTSGNRSMPIIMISADASEGREPQTEERLHNGYLVKPILIESLLEHIRSHLNLTWRYDIHDTRGAEPLGLLPRDRTRLPLPEHLDELRRLAGIGHVAGLEVLLDRIEGDDPETADFIRALREHLHSFRIDELVSTLEEVSRADA